MFLFVDQRQLLPQVLADLLGLAILAAHYFPVDQPGPQATKSSPFVSYRSICQQSYCLLAGSLQRIIFLLVIRGQRPPKFFLHWLTNVNCYHKYSLICWVLAAYYFPARQTWLQTTEVLSPLVAYSVQLGNKVIACQVGLSRAMSPFLIARPAWKQCLTSFFFIG